MKRTVVTLLLAGLVLAAASTADAFPRTLTLTIRHQTANCHAWAVTGGAYRFTQVVRIARGGAITVVNRDIMPHRLVQVAGPYAAVIRNLKTPDTMPMMRANLKPRPGLMAHMGAASRIAFSHAGVYRFTTRFGEDYAEMPGMATKGEDAVLRLVVHVS